jgi:acyl-[acyl-carrier-protein]-phospholipid O-acyltransferase/long-chain-fatty-acid--[acyl-carrier-protein] ligase
VPALLIRFTFWVVTHTLYRTRVRGSEHLPFRGPVVLVANHVSHIDGLLVGACVQRFIRFTVAQPEYQVPGLRWLWRLMKAIPIGEKGEASWGESVARLRAELKEGHTVCLFAEGAISRTGNLLPFKPTLKAVLEGMPEVPVIPVSIDGLWGSLFAYSGGRFAWQWPARFPNPVWISFGAPLAPGFKPEEARQAILGLSAEAARLRIRKDDLLHWQFIRTACRLRLNFFMSDSSGRELRFYKGLTTALALSRWVRRHCADQRMVGLLLPPSVPGALMNYAVMIAGKIPINLNYTIGKDAMAHAVKQCGIRTVLTTPLLLEKLAIERTPEMVYMEELAPQLGTLDKLPALLASLLLPHRLIRALYAPEQTDPEELATIIFSSGSTGVPKGVMLSHRNILSNIRGAEQVIWITPEDRILGILPFFHSFGFTIILWFPAVAGFGVAFHPVPTDAKAIGELCQKYDVSIMVSTPTFYGHYIRKCEPEQFHKLRFAVAGAEKLRQATATAFREKFGQDLYEGYGCTELSPVVAVNVPDHLEGAKRQVGLKPGSVGHPLPGVTARVIDPDTGAELGTGQQGMIEVKGPNLMMGYLNAPEKTAEVVRKGWYLTGDIGWMDEDGFLHLTDRLFRFSKIGGEMVPHIRVEEVLQAAWPEEGFGVTAVPDEAKGERLVVLYTNPERRPDELKAALESSALPKLWIPKTYYPVEAIPVLGTGKTDLREMKRVALQRAGMLVD